MLIERKFLVENDTYKNPVKIKPEYIIVHSTACGYRNKDQLFNGWNKSGKLSVHGMVDETGSYQTLPLNYLGWHVGSRGNGKTIGFEICEPKNIVYANANHTKVDSNAYRPEENYIDFELRYRNAVELAAYMAKETGIPVDHIVSHKEGWALGIASNHGDPDQWWKLFNKDMDTFRQDVKAKLSESGRKPNPVTGGEIYRVQAGAFRIKANACRYVERLKKAGFDAIVKKSFLMYKVQCGVFHNRENAEKLANKLKESGFSAAVVK